MKLCIESLKVWYPNCEANNDLNVLFVKDNDFNWPKLDFIPAMQRRRLSPFAKIALCVAFQTSETSNELLPIVFSSRHGDIHKTSTMLDDLAHNLSISPTSFGLSVHNAVPGLFSILTKNKNAINAIAAGQDTLFMAMVDAYARIKSGQFEKVLIIHADQNLPEVYNEFRDEQQIPHAVAFILSLTELSDQSITIECDFKSQQNPAIDNEKLPLALSFVQWLNSTATDTSIISDKYLWHFNKHV